MTAPTDKTLASWAKRIGIADRTLTNVAVEIAEAAAEARADHELQTLLDAVHTHLQTCRPNTRAIDIAFVDIAEYRTYRKGAA